MGVTYDSTMEEDLYFLPMSELSLVYSASNMLMGTHTGWYPFALQYPFYYDADSGARLVIVVAKYSYGWNGSLEWYYDDATHKSTISRRCDDEDRSCSFHPAEYDGYSTSFGRPQTRLKMSASVDGGCQTPLSVEANDITAHSATIQWATSNGDGSWELSCGPVGFHPDSTGENIVHVSQLNTNTYTLTNLNANANYDVYVRTICSATSRSAWRVAQFCTMCDYVEEFPYVEGFEDAGWMQLPDCWERRIGTRNFVGVTYWTPRSGNGVLSFGAEYTDTLQLVTLPPMQRVDTLGMSFFALQNYGATLEVGVMEGDNFVLVQDVTSQLGASAYPLQSINVDFSNYHGDGTRMAFRVTHSNPEGSLYIDDLVVSGNSTTTSRTAFNVSLSPVDEVAGQLYAYIDDPYRYLSSGGTMQVDSGAMLNIRVRCYSDEVVVDSATINGVPFLDRYSHVDTLVVVEVTGHMDIRVTFAASLPDLHVVSMSHSPLTAGHDATISWTVRNDGSAATPNGVTWYDRLWISMECRVATEDDNPIFLGEFANVRVLNPGEYYTQTQTVHIPEGIGGSKYLFAIADAHDCYSITWQDSNIAPLPCPAATGQYVMANSAHCVGEHCQSYSGSNVIEYLELANGSSCHDNFFYDTVQIQPGENPDLQAINVISPSIIYSGSYITVTATVENSGDRVSSFRYDALYISNNPTFDSTAVFLDFSQFSMPYAVATGSEVQILWYPVYGAGVLYPNETGIDTFKVSLPDSIYGTAYFYVVVDATNTNYEHAGEDNNIFRSGSVDILLTPYPDLTPTEISVPLEISTAETLSVNYTIVNQGLGEVRAYRNWTDRFYLSTQANGIGNDAVEIGTKRPVSRVTGLEADESRQYSQQLVLPSYLDSGYYYLYVSVDDDNEVFEYLYDNNNVMRMSQGITVRKPDLVVSQLMAEDTLLIGANNRIAYAIENQGQGDVKNMRRTDNVHLSRTQNYDNIQESYNFNRQLSLQADRSHAEEVEICPSRTIPEGHYYLFVDANTESEINELNYENNRSVVVPVYLKREFLSDLQVANIQCATNLQAGDTAHVGFDISNNGTAALNHADLYFAVSATNGADTVRCPIVSYAQTLDDVAIAQNGSMHFDCIALISPAVDSSYTQLLVEVDPRNQIRELDDSNNIGHAMVSIASYPFDLEVQSVSVAGTATTGDSVTLSWTVRNQGAVPNSNIPLYIMRYGTMADASEFLDENDSTQSQINLWQDGIYLSSDAQLDTNDILLADVYNYHFLTPNSTYTESVSLQLPYRNWGDLYLLTKADIDGNTFDNNCANNVMASPIHVDLGLMPDLQITSMSFDRDNVERSQSYMLYYTVQNRGLAATPQDTWVDLFYLDSLPAFDENHLVGQHYHFGQLLPGESYTDSVEIDVPRYDVGTYSFTGKVDATDQVFEHANEWNNTDTMSLYITLPLPSDLIPGAPSFPDTVLLNGTPITINYNLRNEGPNYAFGKVKELVYLSTDNQWSSDDLLVSSQTPTIGIAAGSSTTMTAQTNGSGVQPGNYYVIVRSNAYNALNESSYSNNTVVSNQRIHIDYPSILIGQPYDESNVCKNDRYFRFEATGEHVGQTLLCQVSGVNLQGLYLAYLETPTATHYEYYAGTPVSVGSTDYELMIPSLQYGSYYLLLNMGNVTGCNNNIHINASIVDFDILSVDAARGANSGSLTTRIRGAKFDTIMDFRLEQNGQFIPASKIHVKNSTDAYATFDLTYTNPGEYDVVAELRGGVIVSKNRAFTIEEGLPANLQARIEGPSTVRVGVVFQASVEYRNDGLTDVPIAGLMVISRNGHPIAFSPEGLQEGATQLFVPIVETNGNPDVIRPGHSGTKNLVVYPNSAQEVILDLYTVKQAQ